MENCDNNSKFWEYISQKINRYTPPQNLWNYMMENGLDLSDMPEDIEVPKDIFQQVIDRQINSSYDFQRCDASTSDISCSETSPPPTLLPLNTPEYSIECKYCRKIFCFCDWSIEWHRAHRTDILRCDEAMESTLDGVPTHRAHRTDILRRDEAMESTPDGVLTLENYVTNNEIMMLTPDGVPTFENSVTMPAHLKYMKAVPEAFTPTKGSSQSAGYDLKSIQDITIPARGRAIIDTGLKIQLPEGCYGRVASRSGLAIHNFIDVGAGVIDRDYRGILKVTLFNHSENSFNVRVGDRVAQLICEKICYPDLVEVFAMSSTDRGSGGLGSTGIN